MKNIPSAWVRRQFKKNKVWMATDDDGRPLIVNNKVLIKYQLDQAHEYWVSPDHLRPVEDSDAVTQSTADPPSVKKPKKKIKNQKPESAKKSAQDAIAIYTDGASSGNPGPSGIGIYMEYGRHKREISTYIGISTNNMSLIQWL